MRTGSDGKTPQQRRDERSRGRKFSTIQVTGKTVVVDVDVRVNSAGLFSAQYPIGVWYSGNTVEEVREALRRAVIELEEITWERWISISYSTTIDSDSSAVRGYRSSRHRGVDEKIRPAERRKITGISLAFEVFEVSSGNRPSARPVYNLADEGRTEIGDGRDRHHESEVDAGGGWYYVRGEEETNMRRDPREDGLAMPFSDERWRALVAIRDGLGEVDRRLREVLAGGGAEVGQRLEAIAPAALLPAPAVPRWNTCPECGDVVDPPNGEHFTDADVFRHDPCETWLVVAEVDADHLELRVTDPPDGLADKLANARYRVERHVAACQDCDDGDDDRELAAVVFCPQGRKLFSRVVALEERRLRIAALGEEDDEEPDHAIPEDGGDAEPVLSGDEGDGDGEALE